MLKGRRENREGSARNFQGKAGLSVLTAVVLAVLAGQAQAGSVIVHEDFEDGQLDPRMSYIHSFRNGTNSQPGIKNNTGFGSSRAFGFGKSGAGANAFQNHITWLTVDFGAPTYIDRIQYQQRENGNWGSSGYIYLDGGGYDVRPSRPSECALADSYLGRQPSNDWKSDPAPVYKDLPVEQEVTVLHFRVSDITSSSEMWVDNIVILGGAPVPEPATMLAGLAGLAGIGRYVRRRK
jgi:hypothetical protein